MRHGHHRAGLLRQRHFNNAALGRIDTTVKGPTTWLPGSDVHERLGVVEVQVDDAVRVRISQAEVQAPRTIKIRCTQPADKMHRIRLVLVAGHDYRASAFKHPAYFIPVESGQPLQRMVNRNQPHVAVS